MKYLIVSANNFGNTGDDLIAHTITQMLGEIDPKAETRLTQPPFDAELSMWADVTIVGGGGIIYDHDVAHENVINYMLFIDAAKTQKKPAYVIGVGEQGIVTKAGKAAYRRYLNMASLITVRSKQDSTALREIGVTTKVVSLQDLVFAFDFSTVQRTPQKAAVYNRPLLGFNLAQFSNQGQRLHLLGKTTSGVLTNYSDYIVPDNLRRLFDDFDVKLLCQSKDDLAYYKELSSMYGAELIYPETYSSAPTIIDAYNQCDVILTGRFHGLALSALLNKPVLSAGLRNQKMHKLVREQLPSLKNSFFELDTFISQDIANSIKGLLDKGLVGTVRKDEIAACKNLALENKKYIRQALVEDFGVTEFV